jgi:hypothetical protein
VKRVLDIIMVLVVLVVLGAIGAGCGSGGSSTGQTESPGASGPVGTIETGSEVASTQVERPDTSVTAPDAGLMADSIEYARSLGGVSHEGEMLFFVVGAEASTEAEAQKLLQDGLPSFGDMVSYFIVQKSDNFKGMAPGKWVVIEAYNENPSAENRDFGRRAFPNAYVVQATVLTSDPIPVYEDRLGL